MPCPDIGAPRPWPRRGSPDSRMSAGKIDHVHRLVSRFYDLEAVLCLWLGFHLLEAVCLGLGVHILENVHAWSLGLTIDG
jgi:hypothetical protein